MAEQHPSEEWIEAANCLATVAHQLSSVVHEANNMLQVIAGSAEMIQLNGSLPDAVLRRTGVIADHAHRVSTLLATVRDLSKFAPRQEGDTTDLLAVVNGALDMRRHALNRGHVAVTVEGGDPPQLARASWRPTMQIVLNLLLNAEQAVGGRADAAVAIRIGRSGDRLALSVVDNGAGLPEGETTPFTLHELPDGAPLLGLGLTAAQWLAAREGGRLEVRSEAGGTTAVLSLAAV
jgi:C4-dicarboxylate-specific signal transduction histidine kinase